MVTTTLPAPEIVDAVPDPRARPADLLRPALAGGPGYGLAPLSQVLAWHRQDDCDLYGDEPYRFMRRDAIAGSTLQVLLTAVLARGLDLRPALVPPPGRPVDPTLQADYDLAAQIADYCQWTLDRLDRTADEVLEEHCDGAWTYGTQLADQVWTIVTGGPHAGRLALASIDHRTRAQWAFVVDPYWKVRGILGRTPGPGDRVAVYPRDKFAVATFGSRGGDPRGSSIYGRAAKPWNVRVQIWPESFRYLKRFGSPAPVGYTSEAAAQQLPGADGKTAEESLLASLVCYRTGQALALPDGYSVELLEPRGTGAAFTAMLDQTRIEIVIAILLQARATMEAQHGSKADSQSGQEILGGLLSSLRRWAERMWEWEVLFKIVLYNWGPEIADRLTPKASLGEVDQREVTSFIAALSSAGYQLAPSQLPEIDVMAGLPIRQPGEAAIVTAPPPAAGTGAPNGG